MKEARAIAAIASLQPLPHHLLSKILTQTSDLDSYLLHHHHHHLLLLQADLYYSDLLLLLPLLLHPDVTEFMVLYKSLGRHRQTDKDLSLGPLSVLSCYFGLVGRCCFLLDSFLFVKDLFAAFSEGFCFFAFSLQLLYCLGRWVVFFLGGRGFVLLGAENGYWGVLQIQFQTKTLVGGDNFALKYCEN